MSAVPHAVAALVLVALSTVGVAAVATHSAPCAAAGTRVVADGGTTVPTADPTTGTGKGTTGWQ
ncbi:hypothetical protein E2C11_01865 [Streptomyces lavendulae]|uniref:hypothetical protein n=1 Tax=Streptomyces sp. NPDC047813 TaxID=3154608 RepID=UPI0011CE70EB|nr:hypothetical protein [Streptomyces lavendulae]TXJ86735.1 hypothetical protein E2C11_01865 [Streptomyces lavendulae]